MTEAAGATSPPVSLRKAKAARRRGSVLFAVMAIDNGTSPVYSALKTIRQKQNIFSYSISDNPGGIYLYPVGKPLAYARRQYAICDIHFR